MHAFVANLKKRFSSQPPQWEVRLEPDGYTVLRDGVFQVQGRWSEVREVFAYKDDLFSYDEICIGFRHADDGSYWWVGEGFTGYPAFLQELEARFPEMRRDWFSEVAIPAFARNQTTLWGVPWSPEA